MFVVWKRDSQLTGVHINEISDVTYTKKTGSTDSESSLELVIRRGQTSQTVRGLEADNLWIALKNAKLVVAAGGEPSIR